MAPLPLSSIQYYLLSHKCHQSPEPSPNLTEMQIYFSSHILSGIFHFSNVFIPVGMQQPKAAVARSRRGQRSCLKRDPTWPATRASTRAPREHSREIHARTHASRSTQPYPSPPLLYRMMLGSQENLIRPNTTSDKDIAM